MGILNVTLGTINNTTPGVQDGYRDYSCIHGTTITVGQDYPLEVRTSAAADEQVRVWMDLNNDGQFNPTTELVFSSTGRGVQRGSVRIAPGAVVNTPLRLRVAADYINAPIPTPCSTPQYSQTEDYRVTLQANTTRPQAAFTAVDTVTCTGTVQFRDASQGGATSWRWDFGDGSRSTLPQPQHTYAQPGTYDVRLRACNDAGCDSLVRRAYIRYQPASSTPRAACAVSTTGYCCEYGITRFQLGTLISTSLDARAGYEDYTCRRQLAVQIGNRYPLAVQTGGSNPHDVRLYIDYNDDGVFNAAGELVFEALNQRNPSGELLIPTTAVRNRPLRVRVVADVSGSNPGACGNLVSGQAEDYTLTVAPNTNRPAVRFASTYRTACDATVQFTDQTAALPTSWLWSFGDGSTSTQQHPQHTYAPGTYRVQLRACNVNGCDTLAAAVRLVVLGPGPPATCVPAIDYPQQPGAARFGISRVIFHGIDSRSADARAGYEDFSCDRRATVNAGGAYRLAVVPSNATELAFGRDANTHTRVWIDYNGDQQFSAAEQVYDRNDVPVHLATVTVPLTARRDTPLRMRVINSYANEGVPACGPGRFGQAEDYTVVVRGPAARYEPWFYPHQDTVRVGSAVVFRETENLNLWQGVNWRWDFGDGTSATPAQFPSISHTYTAPGRYTVSLTACNAAGCQTMRREAVVVVIPGPDVRSTGCWSFGWSRWAGRYGIERVRLDSLSVTNQDLLTTYRDLTFRTNAVVTRGQSVRLRANGFAPQENRPRHWRAMVDFDDDGQFSNNETIATSFGTALSTSFVVPSTAVLNRPLRLRVMADTVVVLGCGTRTGQTIDLAMLVQGPLQQALATKRVALEVSPNPATDQLRVSFTLDHPQAVTLELISMLGKRAALLHPPGRLAAGTHALDYDVRRMPLATGTYLLRLTSERGFTIKKVIVSK